MQKRAPLTDENTDVGLSAKQFQDALEKLKKGVRFGYTCNQKNLQGLRLSKEVEMALLNRTCYLPTPEPLTTVTKILPVTIEMDLSPSGGRLPPIITVNNPDWDPSPSSKHELDDGPPSGFRTDLILYQKMRLLRIFNDAPFDVIFYSNLHNFYANMGNAINAVISGEYIKHWPKLERNLNEPDGSPCQGGIPIPFSANLPKEGQELHERVGSITEFLESAQTEMSAACFYCGDEETLRAGIINFEMPHPITRELTWFSAMTCSHLLAAHVINNWQEWNLQIAPLVAGSKETYTLILEEAFANEVIEWMMANMPQKSFAVPASNLVFGVSRAQLDLDTDGHSAYGPDQWHSSYMCKQENPDLSRKYSAGAEIMLTYGLLPQEVSKDRAAAVFTAAQGLDTTDNTKEMQKKLQRDAKAEVESDMNEFSFSKLAI